MTPLDAGMATVLVAAIGAVGTWLANRVGKRGDRENALLDQYQEDRARDVARIDSLSEKVDRLEREVLRLLSRDAQWRIHAERLSDQVRHLDGEPHPLPEELRA